MTPLLILCSAPPAPPLPLPCIQHCGAQCAVASSALSTRGFAMPLRNVVSARFGFTPPGIKIAKAAPDEYDQPPSIHGLIQRRSSRVSCSPLISQEERSTGTGLLEAALLWDLAKRFNPVKQRRRRLPHAAEDVGQGRPDYGRFFAYFLHETCLYDPR